jgi:hypothetical protein
MVRGGVIENRGKSHGACQSDRDTQFAPTVTVIRKLRSEVA